MRGRAPAPAGTRVRNGSNLAEEREAMGKISVILGKRSKEVTGSTSMEVVSGRKN